MGKRLVSVIIPNYNGAHLIGECIKSLLCQTHDDMEIIVVDGASTDGSQELVEQIRERDQRVSLVRERKNGGFVGNANAGLSAAKGYLRGLLNNDAEAEATWVERIVEAAETYKGKIGIFASKVLRFNYGSREAWIESTGDYLQTNGFADSRGTGEPDIGQFEKLEEVFSTTGAAAFYRKELIEEIGVLEPEFGSYLEDVDFGLRANMRGWRCLYVPKAQVWHRGRQTSRPDLTQYFVARNTLFLVLSGFPDLLIRRYLPRIVTSQLRVARRAYRLRNEIGNCERINGAVDAIRMMPSILSRRKRIQAGRIPSEDETIDWWLRWGDEQMARRLKFDHRSNLPLHVP
jgi:GT2 family glycosyltransferase